MTVDANRFTRRLFWGLLCAELLLVLFDTVVTYGRLTDSRHLRDLFNITREDSIPNWFASMLFLLISLAVWQIYFHNRGRLTPRWREHAWGLVAAGFLFLSLDDGSRLHERMGGWAKATFGDSENLAGALLDSTPSYAWHVTMGPLFAIGGLAVLFFCWDQLRASAQWRLFLLGVGLFVGAQVLDFLEGTDSVVESVRAALEVKTYDVTHLSKSVEEFIEMFGQTLMLIAFIRHLGHLGWSLQLERKNPKA